MGVALSAILLRVCGKAVAAPGDALSSFFEENTGQFDPVVRYAAHAGPTTIFVTEDGAIICEDRPCSPRPVKLRLIGSNPHPRFEGTDLLHGRINYFLGRDSIKWHSGVPTYAQVRSRSVYPGVDLAYYFDDSALEYDFTLAPKAEPSQIEFAVENANNIHLDGHGDLAIRTANGHDLIVRKPGVFQLRGGRRIRIDARFSIRRKSRRGPSVIGFIVGAYDRLRPLVIDPQVLLFDLSEWQQ